MGKTGTSQKYLNGRLSGEYIASFVGTFPADNPDYVVLIVVDEPGGASYYGSIAATPYAKKIIENIIKYKNYQPSSDLVKDLEKVNEMETMPNVVGLDVSQAVLKLENLGFQVEIQGEKNIVLSQFPAPNESIMKNSIVMIDTNN